MTHADGRATELAELALDRDITIAVAESLTCGRLASSLGAAPDSGTWFRGGVVAYRPEIKRRVLDVPDVPVVSETAARAMATGVRALMDAFAGVAVTGVGGPDPQDGEPAGSVWFAVATDSEVRAEHRQFDGGPDRVLDQTVEHALTMLLDAVKSARGQRL
ncbi:CinA family protein [Nocardia bhagyanarayanae]|uniref:Nicotinamide-nucleotide amidase n=1 Tax=Nocardia bhagyanarayanae TaxID=1215925 RepID=A0A543EY40_9NOCA|nr:CinA family protein [Nocardia bhagyanarayanae]TQM26506.1 nicotinamide-nucleotide amidase [Nocardia bhagyanarayanae]